MEPRKWNNQQREEFSYYPYRDFTSFLENNLEIGLRGSGCGEVKVFLPLWE